MRTLKQCVKAGWLTGMLLMLMVRPVGAEFTAPEQASIAHLQAAIHWATESYYPREIVNRMTNSTTRPKIASAVELHQKALRATTEALGALLGADIQSAAFRRLSIVERAQYVELARQKLDRAIAFYGYAQGGVQALRLYTKDSTLLDALTRWEKHILGFAKAELQQVNKTLSYTDPYPASVQARSGGVFTVIGPHGDYDAAQWQLWRGQHYQLDAMEYLTTAYKAQATSFGTEGRALLQSMLGAIRLTTDNMLSLAGVSNSGQDPFFRTLAVLRALTTQDQGGLPKIYAFFLEFEYEPWAADMKSESSTYGYWTRAARSRMADAWQHTDQGAWMLMIFPDCSVLTNPQGCGGL